MSEERVSVIDRLIAFCLHNKLVVALVTAAIVFFGLVVAPFDWRIPGVNRYPVAVDAIPDIGENQQIVFTDWPGRSPQDVEDQVTYPLTVALLGIPEVKTIRSTSMFGFSSIFVIFDESAEFYWTRSRILEKLNSLPAGTLPANVAPALGPDATGLGQVYWYTLEGQDPDGRPAGGWDLDELRSVQDWYVRYGLQAAEGVSEVASIGGFVREYQIDVDPDAMRAYGVTLDEVFSAVRESNLDVGARTVEINRVEYVVRGLGFIESAADIEAAVVTSRDGTPVTIAQVAEVQLGPALRRGVLDKGGAEAVGGVVVARYGANPLEVIGNVKDRIAEITPGLPEKAVIDFSAVPAEEVRAYGEAQGFGAYDGSAVNHAAWVEHLRATPRDDWPEWVTLSKLAVVPFYDRTGLIYETLGTLNDAIIEQILITVIVILVMVRNFGSSSIISATLPMAVLMCFIAMKVGRVDANIVALSGIAIAIGTMVDMGIILCENVLKHLDAAAPGERKIDLVYRAAREVGGAIVTAVSTTIVSFLPVFTMIGAEGKLFKPLAFTKTFAIASAVILALTILPTLALLFMRKSKRSRANTMFNTAAILIVGAYLTARWMPLGAGRGFLPNALFVLAAVGGLLLFFHIFIRVYPAMLRWCLAHKTAYLAIPATVVLIGLCAWLGFGKIFGFVPDALRHNAAWATLYHAFPGFGKEFMPPLDEGSYLFMPTTMPHAGIEESAEVLAMQDMAIQAIPEVESVVGKIGRVESALDPAPISMVETVVNYKPEYMTDEHGRRMTFQVDDSGGFVRDAAGMLIPDSGGKPFRNWRDHIQSPDDIWEEIAAAGTIPGSTSAPKLQPIATRLIMLQSGMRAPMGVKVQGPDLETIERVGLEVEQFLREVPGVSDATVFADRIVGVPYLEIDIDREAIARYGLRIAQIQEVIEVAVGGVALTTTVEGRERYPVRVRYMRELRDTIESLERILIPTAAGQHVPLAQLATIHYERGPQMIKSEDTFLVGYVLFDKEDGYAEVDVVEACQAHLHAKLASGEWSLPAGVSYRFAGNYENQVRAANTLKIVLPASLFVIFLILYFEFRAISTTALVFAQIAVAWSGGFILMWLAGQSWFLDITLFDVNFRELFQMHPMMLSVAIWVGFLALFGVATDDGVVVAAYLDQSFAANKPDSVAAIRAAVLEAGERRIRPCLMTTATTILALLPVLTSDGRGSDIMLPMAIPSFGGMTIELLSLFMVPVLYCMKKEWDLRRALKRAARTV